MNVIDIAAKHAEVRMEPGDYLQDGLIYCGHCRTPKQCRINVDGNPRVFGCQCACKERQYQAELKARRDEEMRLRIEKSGNTALLTLMTRQRLREQSTMPKTSGTWKKTTSDCCFGAALGLERHLLPAA